MSEPRRREIVVELERVQLVQKRARTHLMFCNDCRRESDFVSTPDAARIFGIRETDVGGCAADSSWHSQTNGGSVYVCTASLLADLVRRKIG